MREGIVFVGDLHLARNVYASLPSMRGDSFYSLEQVARFCEVSGVPLALLGDTLDRRLSTPEIVDQLLYAVRNIDLVYLVGQHDMNADVQWPDIRTSSSMLRKHLNEALVELSGIKVYGFDCTPRGRIDEKLAKIPADAEILVMHQLIKQVMTIEDQWHLDITQVPAHVKYTIMGDWHGHPQDGETDGRKWAYTGSSCMQSISEPVQKSFILVERIDGQLEFSRIPLKTRPFIYNCVESDDQLKQWCDKIDAAWKKAYEESVANGVPPRVAAPFIALRYSVAIDNAYERIMSAVGHAVDRGEVYLHNIPTKQFVAPTPDYVHVGATVSVQDAIDEEVDKAICPELHAFVTDLAHAPNPKEVAEAFKHSHEIHATPFAAGQKQSLGTAK